MRWGPADMAHNYHPHCGCASCGEVEEAAALADELLADQIINGNADLVTAQHQTMEVGNE